MKIQKEFKVGLLALGAIILLIFGYSFLRGNNLLDNNRTFYVTYDNVEGLAVSAPVTINGFVIGKVVDIQFADTKGNLVVTFLVDNDFKFGKSSIAKIYGGNLIGGKSLSIEPRYEGRTWAESGDTLKGDKEEGLIELVNDRLTPLQRKVEKVIVSADSVLTSVNDMLNSENQENLQSVIRDLSATMKSFKSASYEVNGLLATNQTKLNRTFTNLDEMSTNLNKITDTLSQVRIGEMVNDFQNVTSEFETIARRLKDGKGTAGKLLYDEAIYDNMDRATRQLDLLLQDLKLNPKRYVHFSLFGKRPREYEKPEDSLK